MGTVQENISEVKELEKQVNEHCMCLRFSQDKEHYLVLFPVGYQLGGVRVSKGMGKIKALKTVLEKMEAAWNWNI